MSLPTAPALIFSGRVTCDMRETEADHWSAVHDSRTADTLLGSVTSDRGTQLSEEPQSNVVGSAMEPR